jgi:hypothetical protein
MSHHSTGNINHDSNAQKLLKKKRKELKLSEDKILHLNDSVKAKTEYLKEKRCSEKSKIFNIVNFFFLLLFIYIFTFFFFFFFFFFFKVLELQLQEMILIDHNYLKIANVVLLI